MYVRDEVREREKGGSGSVREIDRVFKSGGTASGVLWTDLDAGR